MKIKIQKICAFFSCLVLVFSAFSALVPIQAHAETALPVATVEEAQPRADEIKIYDRTYNGRQQYRIWSVTRACWLTDWIDCP